MRPCWPCRPPAALSRARSPRLRACRRSRCGKSRAGPGPSAMCRPLLGDCYARRGVGRLLRGAAGLACPLDRGLAAAFAEPLVERLHPLEDQVGGRLLLLTRRVLDLLEPHRLAVEDRHLRKAEALPVPRFLRADDRGRHNRGTRLECQPAEARLRLTELTGARAAALRIHEHDVAASEDRVRGLEGLLVAEAAADREHAAMGVDELHRPLEQL